VNVKPNPLSLSDAWELVAEGYASESQFLMRDFSLQACESFPLAAEADVIEVAAGPGTLCLELAPRVRHIEAVDFSPHMIGLLEQRARAIGVSNVRAQVADGQALPFEDQRFDAGFSLFGLMFFPDRPRGYAELLRVLKPDGMALVSSWAPLDDSPLMALMFAALRAADETLPPPRRDPLSLENPEVLASEMRSAGFADVEVKPCTRAITTGDACAVWESMARSAPLLALLRRRVGEAEWQRRSQIGIEHVARALDGKTVELSTTAWFGTGRKPATPR
jgi:SAM-dependent methyltransferase